VVVHEDESIHVHRTKVQVMRQLREESLAIFVAVKDVRTAVPAAGDMIHGVGTINPWRAWHTSQLPQLVLPCKP